MYVGRHKKERAEWLLSIRAAIEWMKAVARPFIALLQHAVKEAIVYLASNIPQICVARPSPCKNDTLHQQKCGSTASFSYAEEERNIRQSLAINYKAQRQSQRVLGL